MINEDENVLATNPKVRSIEPLIPTILHPNLLTNMLVIGPAKAQTMHVNQYINKAEKILVFQ